MGLFGWLRRQRGERPGAAAGPDERAAAPAPAPAPSPIAAETRDPAPDAGVSAPSRAFELRLAALIDSADGAGASAAVRDLLADAAPAGRAGAASATDALAKIATGARTPAVRRCAVERIDDIEVLISVATKDAENEIRRTAIARIRDEAALAGFA
ncbi:MAG: hypothetical protein V3R77_06090, partial [Candidatus Binatia bacterium]